jgi:hypothetical protein
MTDLKKIRFTEEQFIGLIKQVEAVMPLKELGRSVADADLIWAHFPARGQFTG